MFSPKYLQFSGQPARKSLVRVYNRLHSQALKGLAIPCKQKYELNSFRQDELDRFRKYELNSFGQWPNFGEGGLTKALGYERISNPTVHVILRRTKMAAEERQSRFLEVGGEALASLTTS